MLCRARAPFECVYQYAQRKKEVREATTLGRVLVLDKKQLKKLRCFVVLCFRGAWEGGKHNVSVKGEENLRSLRESEQSCLLLQPQFRLRIPSADSNATALARRRRITACLGYRNV